MKYSLEYNLMEVAIYYKSLEYCSSFYKAVFTCLIQLKVLLFTEMNCFVIQFIFSEEVNIKRMSARLQKQI